MAPHSRPQGAEHPQRGHYGLFDLPNYRSPYLHDGRATTLEQAVAFHGEESTKKFNALSLPEKQKLLSFLKSLVVPEQLAAR